MSDPQSAFNTVTLTVGGVLTAFITGVFAWLGLRTKPAKPDPAPITAPTPLSTFSGTQNEFMALVIKDNAELRDEMRELNNRVSDVEREHSTFKRAVKIYLQDLASAWPGPGSMPWPNDRDLAVLEHTLPRRRSTSP